MQKLTPPFLTIVSSQANIRNTFFDQRSPRHPDVGVGPKPYILAISEKGTYDAKMDPPFFFENFVITGIYLEYVL